MLRSLEIMMSESDVVMTSQLLLHTAVDCMQPFNCGMYILLCDHFGLTQQI